MVDPGSGPVDAVVVACRGALAALGSEAELLELADRESCSYLRKPVRHHFRTAQAWVHAIERGDAKGIGCLWSLTSALGSVERTRSIILSALAAPGLHGAEDFVLECLRELVRHDDEAAYRTLLRFAVRSWAGGWIDFDEAVFVDKVRVLLEFLREQPRPAAPRAWPKVGAQISEAAPAGELPCHGDLIEGAYVAASGAERAALKAVAQEMFDSAGTAELRCALAITLARLGESAACFELCESALETDRFYGFDYALKYFGARTLDRYGHVFDSETPAHAVLRESFLEARGKRLGPPAPSFDGQHLLAVYTSHRWDPGNVYGADARDGLRLAWFDRKQQRVSRDDVIARVPWEPQATTVEVEQGRGEWVAVSAVNSSARAEIYYVSYGGAGAARVARTKAELQKNLRQAKPKGHVPRKATAAPKGRARDAKKARR